MKKNLPILFDASLFIGALSHKDPRHSEAFPLVEAARRGGLSIWTTTSILSKVCAALTWVKAQSPQSPAIAAQAIRLLLDLPSAIKVLPDGKDASFKMLDLVEKYAL